MPASERMSGGVAVSAFKSMKTDTLDNILMAGSWQNPHMNAVCGEINLRGPNILWIDPAFSSPFFHFGSD